MLRDMLESVSLHFKVETTSARIFSPPFDTREAVTLPRCPTPFTRVTTRTQQLNLVSVRTIKDHHHLGCNLKVQKEKTLRPASYFFSCSPRYATSSLKFSLAFARARARSLSLCHSRAQSLRALRALSYPGLVVSPWTVRRGEMHPPVSLYCVPGA
jgi:hypothetical protein